MHGRRGFRGGTVAAILSAAIVLAGTASASAATLIVDDDGFALLGNCDAAMPAADSATIQGGVNAASTGDTIVVCPGTYSEQVNVNKAVILQGAQAGVHGAAAGRPGTATTESIVDGTTVASGRTSAFVVTASNVTIDG